MYKHLNLLLYTKWLQVKESEDMLHDVVPVEDHLALGDLLHLLDQQGYEGVEVPIKDVGEPKG